MLVYEWGFLDSMFLRYVLRRRNLTLFIRFFLDMDWEEINFKTEWQVTNLVSKELGEDEMHTCMASPPGTITWDGNPWPPILWPWHMMMIIIFVKWCGCNCCVICQLNTPTHRATDLRYGELEVFLLGLDLSHLVGLFQRQLIDLSLLMTLTEQDLINVSQLPSG